MEPRFSREILHRWLLAIACAAILLFFFSPSWAAFRVWTRVPELSGMIEVRRGMSVLVQMDHPGTVVADPLHRAIRWRLLFPALGHVLNFSPFTLFGLADVGCLLALAFVVTLLRRNGWSWTHTLLATIVFGAGDWFFVSTGWLGYFDAWLVLALLVVAFDRNRWCVWTACLLAPWIDERFLIGAPLALMCRHWYFSASDDLTANESRRRETGIALALLGGFLVVRVALLPSGATSFMDYFVGLDRHDTPVPRIALGVWEGMRAGWIFVIGAVFVLSRTRRASAVTLAGAVLVVAVVGLATAQDFSRSMMLLTPVIVFGFIVAARASANWLPRALSIGAAATLLLPAHHVMSDQVNPIYYLYHELAAFESPPAAVMPELHELRGIRAMQDGDFVGAAEALSLAIKLAENPAAPSRQRGVLFASQQRWKEARDDFGIVIKFEPNSPDGWFLRAQANAALGDSAAAATDFQHALTVAPPGWSDRGDVQRFRAKLRL